VLLLACPDAMIRHTSDDFRAIVALVAAGSGVALVPRNAFTQTPGAIALPVKGNQSLRRVFAAVRKGSEDRPLIRLVLAALVHGQPADT